MTQLWIGNTEVWQNEEQLGSYIREHCGVSARSIWLRRDRSSGKLEGYGFIDFSDSKSAAHVMRTLNDTAIPHAPGHKFRLNWGTSRSETDTETLRQAAGYQVYVGNLPTTVTSDRLLQLFRRSLPRTISARLIHDAGEISKGFGFVKFNTFQEVKDAIHFLNGSTEFGRPIKVSEATSNRMQGQDGNDVSSTLFIRDIDPGVVKEDTLLSNFSPYGHVLRVQIEQEHPDWAYVTMEKRMEAESARNALQGSRFGGTTKCDIQFGRAVDDVGGTRGVTVPEVKPKTMTRKQQARYFDEAGIDKIMKVIARVAELGRPMPISMASGPVANRVNARLYMNASAKAFDWSCTEGTVPAASRSWFF